MFWFWFCLSAFVLGIGFCAPPGAIMAQALRRGLAGGFWPVLLLELGSLIGDATWAIIALSGITFLVQNPLLHLCLEAGGGLLLLYLGWNALRDAWRGGMPEVKGGKMGGNFTTGALISLANPLAIAYWLGMGGVVTAGIKNPQMVHFVVFFVCFMFAALVWCFFIAGLISWGRRLITPTFFRWINLLCGLALLYFAVTRLWSAVQILAG